MGRTFRREPHEDEFSEPFVITPTNKPPPKGPRKGRRKRRWQDDLYETEDDMPLETN